MEVVLYSRHLDSRHIIQKLLVRFVDYKYGVSTSEAKQNCALSD